MASYKRSSRTQRFCTPVFQILKVARAILYRSRFRKLKRKRARSIMPPTPNDSLHILKCFWIINRPNNFPSTWIHRIDCHIQLLFIRKTIEAVLEYFLVSFYCENNIITSSPASVSFICLRRPSEQVNRHLQQNDQNRDEY